MFLGTVKETEEFDMWTSDLDVALSEGSGSK